MNKPDTSPEALMALADAVSGLCNVTVRTYQITSEILRAVAVEKETGKLEQQKAAQAVPPVGYANQWGMERFINGGPNIQVTLTIYKDHEPGRFPLYAAPQTALKAGQAVPQGWQMVPAEPTNEMWAAVNKLDDEMYAGSFDGKGCSILQAWRCMLESAPQPPEGPKT